MSLESNVWIKGTNTSLKRKPQQAIQVLLIGALRNLSIKSRIFPEFMMKSVILQKKLTGSRVVNAALVIKGKISCAHKLLLESFGSNHLHGL